MKIDAQVSEIKIDVNRHIDKVRDEKLWLYTAQQWHRLYYDYIPYDTGTLANDVVFDSSKGMGQITHNAPYARYVYNGHFNFRKSEGHMNASREWDKAAEPVQKPKLISAVQAYIDSGRLDLNG